ncbi:DNA-binding response OmpR family regulator [Yoonia maricola]|uniref:DNA-binding response OmpR family regulator n=1 Tax=Yoonia maricola TaxID=420999 RepID=A0A2M8W084_9RHOB|nr:response regulator transcription factor [Yoonia maricola]PJI84337.1 DNA-binding response OmpR family regulator [Yoonia maricola]
MKPAPLITVLDDTPEIRSILSDALEQAGFRVRSFGRAAEFEHACKTISPDACIIDLGLPDSDGLALVHRFASQSDVPILIISGRSRTSDKIVGLELGADDYIIKPFEVEEVIARLRVILRRTHAETSKIEAKSVRFCGWTADLDLLQLTKDTGEHKSLTFAENEILKMFLAAPNRLIKREQILDYLGSNADDAYDRSIDVKVSRLRTKLGDDAQNARIIKTVYGAGYIFIAEVHDA